jgi:hypothetical protein
MLAEKYSSVSQPLNNQAVTLNFHDIQQGTANWKGGKIIYSDVTGPQKRFYIPIISIKNFRLPIIPQYEQAADGYFLSSLTNPVNQNGCLSLAHKHLEKSATTSMSPGHNAKRKVDMKHMRKVILHSHFLLSM